ncbi:zinc metalloprotease HtpX [Actinocatenispora rupis]|uniref:Peptidase M48 n=2 Tax=Actinocatenispora rupis TaxID=519421 RepID=A0A8J3JE37_9ACTN|nr:M48 family metalloprotease [Actinocatenispora rupis]GID15024.1 peptidase M48 [Actinocatenispora rupis]
MVTAPWPELAAAPSGAAGPWGAPPVPPAASRSRLSDRPARFPSVYRWVVAGIFRDWRGVLAAYLSTWFGLPGAVLLSAVGAVLGLVAGAGGGTVGVVKSGLNDVPLLGDLFGQSGLEMGGILGGLVGIVLGAVLGLVGGMIFPWFTLFAEDPLRGVGALIASLLVGFLVGVLYTIYRITCEGWILRVTGARRLSRREEELLVPLVRDCAERLQLKGMPTVLMDDDRLPNAFAWTRHIVINQGLLDEFNYDPVPISGVISHELTHWNNADSISRTFIRGVALPLYLLYTAVSFIQRAASRVAANRFGGGSAVGFVMLACWLILWPILVTIKYFIMPMQAADSRAAEYRADQGAVAAGHRDGIRQVLARFRRSFDGTRNGWELSICASHPPNELRLEAIEEPGRPYPLPDPDSPPRPIPVAVSTLDKD